jgi:hypothetical protein
MRMQPRQHLLDVWRATVRSSYQDGRWVWGGREQPNSVTDAEQLLCLVLPATELSAFALDNPDQTDTDVLEALRALGNAAEIPRRLVTVLSEYYERYSDEQGVPLFHGGNYFTTADPDDKPTPLQLELDVVESYSVSITLTLATIAFARNLGRVATRAETLRDVARLEQLASRRLTASLVGLLRSFTVNAFDVDSDPGRYLLQTVNQEGLPERRLTEELSQQLRDVTVTLRDLLVDASHVDLDSPSRLYECGWSWGVIRGAPPVDLVQDPAVVQREGYAEDAPYLYFTVVALDGIADLFAERTRRQRLLTETQQQLAAALEIRRDMTQRYWATIAGFGAGRWPLEDLPWRTTDGAESDYFSLLVTSIAARDLAAQRGTDADLRRLGQMLAELANRARVTRRSYRGDPGVGLHVPGVAVTLGASEASGPLLTWVATDFSPLLLKRSIRVAEQIKTANLRAELLALVDQVWDHVLARRHARTGDPWYGIWDQPANAFPQAGVDPYDQPSWHHTYRVVESLRYAANLTAAGPLAAIELTTHASHLLTEAEHLFDQEQLAGSTEGGPRLRGELQSVHANIARAREILTTRPGTAVAMLSDALLKLERLAAARRDTVGAL